MIHVGIDAASWSNQRGFGRFVRELITALAARDTGFRYTLLFDQRPDDVFPPGVDVLSANTHLNLAEAALNRPTRSIADLWRMSRAARRAQFDVFFYPAVYSYFPLLSRVPCVMCYYDATQERFPQWIFPRKINHLLWIAKMAMARVQGTRAIAVSQSAADDVEHMLGIPRSRIDIIPGAAGAAFREIADPAVGMRARARYGIPAEATLLVVLGAMNPHKNHVALLEAMRVVVAQHPEVHLAIVGATTGKGFFAYAPRLMEFVSGHPPLEHHVHFTGFIADAELVALFNATNALVFPSLWEGFGLPAVEAMSCGVPVLASDRGSLPEVVGDAGLFFDPTDPAAIAACILRFVNQPDVREQLVARGRSRAKTYSWEQAAELAEASFRRCIGR